jgi:DNA-binding NarL/FixJ family response regulator
VAKRLFITEGTVKMHLHNIYEKLELDSRIQLSRYAQKKGLV